MLFPVILAGGFGERLQPLSSEEMPKQFLPLVTSNSLLQDTINRLALISNIQKTIISFNVKHRQIIETQLDSNLNIQMIAEPFRRNTAPAIIFACFYALSVNHDAIMVVTPSDSLIRNINNFRSAIETGIGLAKNDAIAILGIPPAYPSELYGYILKGNEVKTYSTVYEASYFIEKPKLQYAKKYTNNGQFLWNSGTFVAKASVLIEEIKQLNPALLDHCLNTWNAHQRTDQLITLDPSQLEACPSVSIDHALMEKTKKALVIEADMGWADIGSWEALSKIG